MEHRTAGANRVANRTLALIAGVASLAFAEMAIAAGEWTDYFTTLTTDEWSAYLLYGSIALLICGVLLKMFTYRGLPESESRPFAAEVYPAAGAEERYTIGDYRNRALIPGP